MAVVPKYPRPRGPIERILGLFRKTRRTDASPVLRQSGPAVYRPTEPAAFEPPDRTVRTSAEPSESRRFKAFSLRLGPLAWGILGAILLLIVLQSVWTLMALSDKAVAAAPDGKLPPRADLEARNRALQKKLGSFPPRGTHIVIDTGANRLYLKNGSQVLRDAVVSCGSGSILTDPAGGRTWMFDTPRGEFQVRSRQTNPNWVKPDWAFIEEGEPIPDSYNERVEPGMLGEYAMGIGGGYFIHGTLYTRMLGRNVTHGCVRVGDEDLEFVFKRAALGTRVYIF